MIEKQMKSSSFMDVLNFSFLILIFTLFTWTLKYYWDKRKLYKLSACVPGPKNYPIFGTGLQFLGASPEDIFQKLMKYFITYPDIFKFWLGPKLIYGISKPEHLEIILNHPKCLAKDPIYKYPGVFMGKGLFSAPLNIWKNNRKLINPTFNQKILDSFVRVFSEQAKVLIKILENKAADKNVDIFPIISACNVDTICETAMGIKVNAQTQHNHFGEMLDEAMAITTIRMLNIWYHNNFLFGLTKHKKKIDNILEKLHNFTGKVIEEKKQSYQEKLNGIKNGDVIEHDDNKWKTFLDLLLHLNQEDSKFSDEQLRDEVNTFMAAGSDTTAASISFCLLTLGMHPEIQKKVYDEIINVLGEDREVTPSDLPRFHIMDRCIKETLRLFPVGPFFLRTPSVDIQLDDITVPAHSTFFFGLLHTHRNPKYWNDPLKFDPDRFLPEEIAKRHPYSFLPFSGGPRACIGSKYAIMAIKSILATFIRKFMVDTEYKSIEEVELKLNLLLRPTNGFKVSLKRRE